MVELPHVAKRLRVVVDELGEQTRAATVAGISSRQLRKYLAAQSNPSAIALARLCAVSGHSLDWLLIGRGAPKRGAVDCEERTAAPDAAAAVMTVGQLQVRPGAYSRALLEGTRQAALQAADRKRGA